MVGVNRFRGKRERENSFKALFFLYRKSLKFLCRCQVSPQFVYFNSYRFEQPHFDPNYSASDMLRSAGTIFRHRRLLHTCAGESPSETLKRTMSELKKKASDKKKTRKKKKDEFIVQVPESSTYLDSATMPMVLTGVAIALFAKVLMMYDESTSQERIERKIRNAPEGQGSVRMLSREEWDTIQEVRPRTPFESKLARPNARLRTGEPLHVEDVKDWAIDVLIDALTRVEETVRHHAKDK